jgi:hypothetical protein
MFDINLETIELGSVLEMETCEKLFGYLRKDDPVKYQFDLMRLADYIYRESVRRGRVFTIICDKSDIRVLTHQQASDYNQQHYQNAIKKMRKCHRRLVAVNTAELDAEKVQNHDKSIIRQSRILQMIKAEGRGEITAEPRKHDRPAMFKKVSQ